MERGAELSPCGAFRFHLWRIWTPSLPMLTFIMLNPSTADGLLDDPTIRKCMGFARRNGFGGIHVVNVFAYRATKPADLKAAGWPTGVPNLAHIAHAMHAARATGGKVVAAWGANIRAAQSYATEVVKLAEREGVTLHALRLTADGIPCHPLMLPYSCELQPFGGA